MKTGRARKTPNKYHVLSTKYNSLLVTAYRTTGLRILFAPQRFCYQSFHSDVWALQPGQLFAHCKNDLEISVALFEMSHTCPLLWIYATTNDLYSYSQWTRGPLVFKVLCSESIATFVCVY